MRADSSKRSRASFMSMPNASYSMRARPRPNPSTKRLSLTASRTEAFSARRNGLFHGRITAAVPSWIFLVRAASQVKLKIIGGDRVVVEVVLGAPDDVE